MRVLVFATLLLAAAAVPVSAQPEGCQRIPEALRKNAEAFCHKQTQNKNLNVDQSKLPEDFSESCDFYMEYCLNVDTEKCAMGECVRIGKEIFEFNPPREQAVRAAEPEAGPVYI